jgi:DNA-binding CsgD family transcriptional regulator
MSEYGEPLTEREQQLLQMVATGITNREVAHQLNISVNTVKVHLRNIYAKLGAESRTEATMIAVREGWVTVEGAEETPAGIGGAPATQTQFPPVAPEPPLPWSKRVALVVALLLVVAGTAVTWPHSSSQADNGHELPLPPAGGQPEVVLAEDTKWHEKAQMPTRRAYLALTAVGGHIFAIAGRTPEEVTDAVEVYDPDEDIWARGSDKPTPVTYVSAAVIGREIYVPGGCDAADRPLQTVEVYNTLTDSWREGSPLPEPRCAYALATLEQKLYLFGGWDGERYVNTTYVYDPQAGDWTESTPRGMEGGFAAAAPLGGRVYVVGGYDGERELTTCKIYAPETETWTECAPLAVGRGGLSLAALGNQLYAIGGGGWTSYLGFNERYDPRSDAWNPVETPLAGEWLSPGTAVVDNAIYVIGGWSGDYLSHNRTFEPLHFRVFIPLTQSK